jgi:hypothetical protein
MLADSWESTYLEPGMLLTQALASILQLPDDRRIEVG